MAGQGEMSGEIIQRDGYFHKGKVNSQGEGAKPQWEGKFTRRGERSKRVIVHVFRAAS